MSAEAALEVLADDEGSVTVGWAGEHVLYACFTETFGGKLSGQYAARLEALIRPVESLHYFANASALRGCDLLARSAFARVVFANRLRFKSVVILTSGKGVGFAERALSEALGDSAEFMTEASAFEARLMSLAPQARRALGSEWPKKAATAALR